MGGPHGRSGRAQKIDHASTGDAIPAQPSPSVCGRNLNAQSSRYFAAGSWSTRGDSSCSFEYTGITFSENDRFQDVTCPGALMNAFITNNFCVLLTLSDTMVLLLEFYELYRYITAR